MATRVSRRKIAAYAADEFVAGRSKTVLKELAAFLVESRRTRELELLVRDIEEAIAERGIVVANITSAHPLSESLKTQVAALVGGKKLEFRESVDPKVLGGVRIDIPGKRFDGTLLHKLTLLKTKQL